MQAAAAAELGESTALKLERERREGAGATPTIFETRYAHLVDRVERLSRVAGPGSIGDELKDVAVEMKRIRRDMGGMDFEDPLFTEIRPTKTPLSPSRFVPRGGGGAGWNKGTQVVKGELVVPPEGMRWCANHDGGKGAFLLEDLFLVTSTGKRKSWCDACRKQYQRDRYVRLGYKIVSVQVLEGDPCVGHKCPKCDKPFEVGQIVQGHDVTHERCP